MSKIGKMLLEWNTCEIIKNQIEFLKEEYPEDKSTDDELWSKVAQDSDLFQWEYECLCESLTELMSKNKHHGWFARMENFGWRGLSGEKSFQARTGTELLSKILPQCDCQYKIFRYGHGFAIQNFHHDSPIGNEWYYISPKKCD